MERSVERSLVGITTASCHDLDGHCRMVKPLPRQPEACLVQEGAERSPTSFESSLQRSPAHAQTLRDALTIRLALVEKLRQRHPHSVGSGDASLRRREHRVELWPEGTGELAEVVNFARTFPTSAAAFYWQTPTKGTTTHWILAADQKIFEYRLDANPPRAARVHALMSVATYDATVACWDAKYTYWAMRPFQYDPAFIPLVPVPAHPSYPAAHGCHSGSAAAVLAYLFPRDAAALTAQADEAGMARLWGGIHFPSDIRVGLSLGRTVAQRVISRPQGDGSP